MSVLDFLWLFILY